MMFKLSAVSVAPHLIMSLATLWSSQSFAQEAEATVSWDVDVVVTKRVPPRPYSARKSAYCCVTFDIDAEGQPINISTPYCTSKGFSRKAKQTVKQWEYRPATENGIAVLRPGMSTIITSIMVDDRGRPQSGSDGYMKPRDGVGSIPRPPADFSKRFTWQSTYFNDDTICPKVAP